MSTDSATGGGTDAVEQDYAELVSRVRRSQSEYAEARGAVAARWQDAAADRARDSLDAVGDALRRQGEAVGEQSEAHARLSEMVELLGRNVAEIDQLVSRADEEVAAATEHTDRSRQALDEARARSRSSSATLRQALALAGRAGSACGEAIGSGALEGLMHNAVVAGRRREVWKMIGAHVGIEVVHFAAGSLAEKVLSIPDGALPEQFKAQVQEALTLAAPDAEARITRAVKQLADWVDRD